MKKFILKFLIFILPWSAFLFFVEKKLGTIPNSYNTKRKQLETQLDSIQVLVLGSSESLYGINPSFFDVKGYNLSNISQSIFYNTHITLKYIDKMYALKYVLIEIGDFSLNTQLIDGIEAWRDYYYAQFWGIRYPEIPITDFKLYSKIILYTPSYSRELLLSGTTYSLVKDYKLNGWAFNDTSNNAITDSATTVTFERHTKPFPKRVIENYKTLELLITELEKRNIIPVIYTPPVYSTYYNRANPQRDSTTKTVLGLCLKYHLKYYDYFKDDRFHRIDFKDCDHLDFIGAEKFSKILNNDILRASQSLN
jgi:hypothetical protein